MPFHYSTEFRRQVCQRLLAGDPIKSMSIELSISQATLFRWKKQCLIDYDRKPGLKSFEVDELAQLRESCAHAALAYLTPVE